MSRIKAVSARCCQFAQGVSAFALVAAIVGQARAECLPSPVVTHCTGTISGPLNLDVSGATLAIDSGATVSGGNPATIMVAGAQGSPYYGSGSYLSLSVDGAVSSSTTAGVRVEAGTVSSDRPYNSTVATITVGAGGSITGTNGISLISSGGSYARQTTASVDNSGTIMGTGGAALIAADASDTGFSFITNRAGGLIGGISGYFGPISNAGTIDGGGASAIRQTSSYNYLYASPTITNSGIIQSSGTAPTIISAQLSVYLSIDNSGTIANRGSGTAIQGQSFGITNAAGGVISTAGGSAILANGYLTLTNRGTITGDVRTNLVDGTYASIIDSTGGGRIDGNVTLGSGNDIIVGRYDGSTVQTGISGTLDAGGGTDTLRVDFTNDATVNAPIVLPTSIEAMTLRLASGTTVTLGSGFGYGSTITVADGSAGRLINEATLRTSGPAFVTDYFTGITLENRGSIASSVTSSRAAVEINAYSSFVNSGSVDAVGGRGVSLSSGTFDNSGRISADLTGVSLFDVSATNSGTIISRTGTGLVQNGSSGYVTRNSGTIQGAVAGVQTSGVRIDNSGTITGGSIGVALDPYGELYNRAGGVVTGGALGVGPSPTFGGLTFNASVYNAGTINGSVDFGSFSIDSYNKFVALPGGIVNGDLHLARGSTFVTSLINDGPGQYAGVTGRVTGDGNQTIRFRVDTDANTTFGATGFSTVGYDLSNGATLTLTGTNRQDTAVLLAGTGTVDMTFDATGRTQSAVMMSQPFTLPGETSVASKLSVISRGTLGSVRDTLYQYGGPAVQMGGNGSFTNEGTISVRDTVSSTPGAAAISGGTSYASGYSRQDDIVINNGTISLDGAIGVTYAGQFTNTGKLVQNGRTSVGVQNSAIVVNSGTISVGGVAVAMPYQGKLTNSGNITSTGAVAVIGGSYSTINNRAGGIISRGSDTAITGGYAFTLQNAGTINGDVLLSGNSTYIADNGVLNGNLRIDSGNNRLVVRGDGTGVSGTIDLGTGQNSYIRSYTSNANVTLGGAKPVGFASEGVEVLGDAVVVLMPVAGGVKDMMSLYGDGTIINNADVAARGFDGSNYYMPSISLSTTLAGAGGGIAFTNNATVSGRIEGSARSFINNGLIDTDTVYASTLNLATTVDQPFMFSNTGTIRSQSNSSAAYYPAIPTISIYSGYAQSSSAQSVQISNSGTIEGGFSGGFANAVVTMDNSNRIVSTGPNTTSLSLTAMMQSWLDPKPVSIALTNSGTISASGPAYAAVSARIDGPGWSANDMSPAASIAIVNTGTISAESSTPSLFFPMAVEMGSNATLGGNATLSLTNSATGIISSSSMAVVAYGDTGTRFTLDNAGIIRGGTVPLGDSANTSVNIAINVTRAAATIVNSGTITGSIVLGDAGDSIDNRGTIDGDVFMGGGDDRFIQRASAMVTGLVDGGDGTNSLFIDSTGGNTGAAFDFSRFSRFQQVALVGDGSGTALLAGNLALPTVQLMGGSLEIASGTTLATTGATTITGGDMADTVVNRGSIAGSVSLGGGNDRFENRGQVLDTVDLGTGDDVYALYAGSSAVRVDGGDGANTIEYHSLGTDTARASFSRAGLDNFAKLNNVEGVTTIGTEQFARIDVTGGRLIGLAGTTLGGNVFVASDGTFGSAGTVNGAVAVASGGTLSPGASPGVMTVNGSISLASGSTTLFEFVPVGQSDKIIVNGGSVTIASGAVLELAGTLTPGQSRDLIVVNGGGTISGRFTLDPDHPGVLGALRYTTDMLQLIGIFTTPSTANGQQRAAIDYMNGLFVSDQASAGLLTVAPTLLSGDVANSAAFGRLTPEAYATAGQLGVEHGLAIGRASRAAAADTARPEAGLYSFGQSLSDWRTLNGDASGVSGASSNSYGAMAGIGWGMKGGSISAFVGYIDSRQTIAGLDARTTANGVIAGVTGHVESGGFDVTATVAYDGGHGRTHRAAPDSIGVDSSRFALNSLIIDTAIGYSMAVGANWSMRPEAGFTHVSGWRGAVTETGEGPFALAVDKGRLRASFIDAALLLEGGKSAGATLHPWLRGGVRHQLDGRRATASAGFLETAARFTVAGVARPDWLATVGGGVGIDLGRRVRLYSSYQGEFGEGKSHNVNVGARLLF